MNLDQQERILIKDIFNVKVVHEQGDSQSNIVLDGFAKEISNLGENFSLIENPTHFDSLLMERLQIPNTDSLDYLEECMGKCHYAIEKPWNQNEVCQGFIKYSTQIIKNFIYLTQTNPEIFPNQYEIDNEASKASEPIISLAMRVMTHFERRGFNSEILNIFYPKVNEDMQGDFAQTFVYVLIARQRFVNILDRKAFFFASTLQNILNFPDFKLKFISLNNKKFSLEEALKTPGSRIDKQSPLGLFVRLSILGNHYDYFHQEREVAEKFEKKMREDFGSDRVDRSKLKLYADLQNEFYTNYTSIFKKLLQKDSQRLFFQWHYGTILSNLSRAKLGSRLHGSRIENLSHDGMMINLYVCMLNLTKPLFNRESGKYKNIDPEYHVCNHRTALCRYEPLNNRHPVKPKNMQKQFGTITQFFFLAFEYLHVGFVPAQDNFTQIYERKDKYEKLRNDPHYKGMETKIKQELQFLKAATIRYHLILFDESLLRATTKLFDLLLFLLPRWLNFNYESLINCRMVEKYETPELARYLPEHLLECIYKFHSNNFKFRTGYLQLIGEQHVHEIIKITCILLSEEEITSNPYLGANYVELLFLFFIQTKTGIMYQVYKSNQVAQRNLTFSLMRFYNDIAVTGSSNQFYEKFKYRFYVNKIFTFLWQQQIYRSNLQTYFKTEVFERFLNMVMGDTTYCFDQTNEKYENYKQLQNKKASGIFTPEDQQNEDQLSRQIQATTSNCNSNLKLLKELSRWSPQTFFLEAFLHDIVLLLNNILRTFVDPTSFVANRQLLAKFKFDKEIVLSDLVQTYVNLDISQKFASEIIKDTRFFKKQNFSKALQRASNQHQTDITTLEKFQELIGKIQTAVNEDEDDEEIYGEIPDKYLCGLMSTLMKYPVELPSGYIVDRVYIHKHLLNDERDPFTRAPLKNGQWKELRELQDEIQVWKKKRMAELKGANKEVKYGKIGINKKEEEEEFLEKRMNYQDKDMD